MLNPSSLAWSQQHSSSILAAWGKGQMPYSYNVAIKTEKALFLGI